MQLQNFVDLAKHVGDLGADVRVRIGGHQALRVNKTVILHSLGKYLARLGTQNTAHRNGLLIYVTSSMDRLAAYGLTGGGSEGALAALRARHLSTIWSC